MVIALPLDQAAQAPALEEALYSHSASRSSTKVYRWVPEKCIMLGGNLLMNQHPTRGEGGEREQKCSQLLHVKETRRSFSLMSPFTVGIMCTDFTINGKETGIRSILVGHLAQNNVDFALPTFSSCQTASSGFMFLRIICVAENVQLA